MPRPSPATPRVAHHFRGHSSPALVGAGKPDAPTAISALVTRRFLFLHHEAGSINLEQHQRGRHHVD